MNRELKKREQLIAFLIRKYRAMLLNGQEERTKQLGRAKDEQNALINQLNSANGTITFIEQEMQSKEVLIEELKLQIDNLETQLAKAITDKKESVAEKESEIRSLTSYYKQTNDELSNSHLLIQWLKDELLKIQEELEAKDSSVSDLYASVKSLTFWNLDFMREYSVMGEEYNNLKLTADKKAASDAKLVREKEEELHQLKEKIEHALSEGSRNQVIIAELTREREILKDSLENESKKTNDLMSELQITQENLGKTRNEAAELKEHISESHTLNKELEVEVSKLEAELPEVKESLQKKLDDEKDRIEMLTSELRTAKEDLKKSQVELQSMSHELTAAVENRGSLQRELVDAYKKSKTAVKELNEEKMLVASLNEDVQALESKVFKEREAKRSLELNLEETTKSLDETKQNALNLSGQLKRSYSRILNLSDNNEVLQKLLTDPKNAPEQTLKNLEDARSQIKKLGMERDNLEGKANKLEEELASAKAEILRLRSQQISSSKIVSNDEGESKVIVNEEKKG